MQTRVSCTSVRLRIEMTANHLQRGIDSERVIQPRRSRITSYLACFIDFVIISRCPRVSSAVLLITTLLVSNNSFSLSGSVQLGSRVAPRGISGSSKAKTTNQQTGISADTVKRYLKRKVKKRKKKGNDNVEPNIAYDHKTSTEPSDLNNFSLLVRDSYPRLTLVPGLRATCTEYLKCSFSRIGGRQHGATSKS